VAFVLRRLDDGSIVELGRLSTGTQKQAYLVGPGTPVAAGSSPHMFWQRSFA